MCAGITVYHGLFNAGVKPIDRVAVVGIGQRPFRTQRFTWHGVAMSRPLRSSPVCFGFGSREADAKI